eukprot:scaffold30415_cov124-Isochrysis_galbana.AAC.13
MSSGLRRRACRALLRAFAAPDARLGLHGCAFPSTTVSRPARCHRGGRRRACRRPLRCPCVVAGPTSPHTRGRGRIELRALDSPAIARAARRAARPRGPASLALRPRSERKRLIWLKAAWGHILAGVAGRADVSTRPPNHLGT